MTTTHPYEHEARAAYEAYCETRAWKSFRGEPLPQWPEVLPDIKHGWRVAAQAAIEAYNLREILTKPPL